MNGGSHRVPDAEDLRRSADTAISLLVHYLSSLGHESVLRLRPPGELLSKWRSPFPSSPSPESLFPLLSEIIQDSLHLHHPHFVGHQVCPPLHTAAVCDLVSSFLNNGAAVYEMGPLAAVFEKILIEWMSGLIGWKEHAGGFFTSGGSLGNLTALLAARQARAGEDVWRRGTTEKLAVLVSDQAHYCTKRAVQIMGWGDEGAITVPSDDRFKMDMRLLKEAYKDAHSRGRRVITVVGSACSTSTGSFDDLEAIGLFCKEHGLWFHVDGAHGASLLLSSQYSSLLQGIDLADSVVWDAHKMMLMPALMTAVLFKDKMHSYMAFKQNAAYIYEGESEDEWYTLGKRTLECTKSLMAMKLYVSLMTHGTGFFENYVTSRVRLCRQFASYLSAQDDFELAADPECNIICFRFVPRGVKRDLDQLQSEIREAIVASGEFYLVKTVLKTGTYLRLTIINPKTEMGHLVELCERVREVGKSF